MSSKSSLDGVLAVVAGGIGTDITALGLTRIVGPGELEFGGELRFGAGGKSRNIAEMIAHLTGPGKVAMVGKTSRDPLGLWKVPVDALRNAGVNTDYIKIEDFEATGKYPQVALIAVDKRGNNQIYVLPGVNQDFSARDVDAAEPVFAAAAKNNGIAVLSLELPLATALAVIEAAGRLALPVLLDPGGIRAGEDYERLFDQPISLIKPNEYEASMLTGIEIASLADAHAAAAAFLARGVARVLITLGASGALYLSDEVEAHIPVPQLAGAGTHDETGCGDQTMATLCARLLMGDDIVLAAQRAVLAGTLQFHKHGIVPVAEAELDEYLS